MIAEKKNPAAGYAFATISAKTLTEWLGKAGRLDFPNEPLLWFYDSRGVFSFRTREGRMGVIETAEAGPDRVKVRYKLVTEATRIGSLPEASASQAEIAPGIPLPGVVETANGFLQAIAENRLSDAAKLADDGYAQTHLAGWNKAREAMDFSVVRIGEAWASADYALVLTSALTARTTGKTFFLAFTLKKAEGRWVIWKGRQLGPDSRGAFIQEFQKAQPGAKPLTVTPTP